MQDNEPINITYGQLSDMVNRIEQIPSLSGAGAPTSSTPAFHIGQTYLDTTTDELYYCASIPGENDPLEYTWEPIAGDVPEYVAGDNVTITDESGSMVISATDTTYSNFVGTDGTAAGAAGLVPAPATTDVGKFLKADGTWDTAGGGGATPIVKIVSSIPALADMENDKLYSYRSGDNLTVYAKGVNQSGVISRQAITPNMYNYAKKQDTVARQSWYAAARAIDTGLESPWQGALAEDMKAHLYLDFSGGGSNPFSHLSSEFALMDGTASFSDYYGADRLSDNSTIWLVRGMDEEEIEMGEEMLIDNGYTFDWQNKTVLIDGSGQPAIFEAGCLVKQGGSPLTFGEIKTLAAANMQINMIALYTGGGVGGATNWPIIFYS